MNKENPDTPQFEMFSFVEKKEKTSETTVQKVEVLEQGLDNELAGDIVLDKKSQEAEDNDKLYAEKSKLGPVEIIAFSGTLPSLLSGVISAVLTLLAAVNFAEIAYAPALTVTGFGLGFLAWIDYKTHTIKNEHTIALAVLVVPLTVIGAIVAGNPLSLLFAALMSAVIFGIFILLIIITGFGSGGDIKLAPVPAFILGAVSPLAAILWLFLAFAGTLGNLLILRIKYFAFGPAMPLALPLAIISTYYFYDFAGLPYLN